MVDVFITCSPTMLSTFAWQYVRVFDDRCGTTCDYRFCRLVGGDGSLKVVCISALGWPSSKRKLDRDTSKIRSIGGILAKMFFEY